MNNLNSLIIEGIARSEPVITVSEKGTSICTLWKTDPLNRIAKATMQSNGHVLLIMQKISCKKLLKLVKNMKGQCGNNKVNV